MLYTVLELAKTLNIPESTARYYRDRHSEYFHYVGKGRKKRYTAEALEVLRFICDQASKSKNAVEIAEALQAQFTREIDIAETTAVEQQAQNSIQLLNTTLREIADQKKEIQSLRDEVEELRKYIKIPFYKRFLKRGKD